MTTAAATGSPLVLIDGVPEPRLELRQHQAVGPLDERTALVSVSLSGRKRELPDRLLSAQAVIASAHRLIDDRIRWHVLTRGRLRRAHARMSESSDQQLLELVDDWGDLLGRGVEAAWWQTDAGLRLNQSQPGRLLIGPRPNRSAARWTIHGRHAHVLQERGQAWTVGDALDTLSALAKLELNLAPLPRAIARLPLTEELDLSAPVGRSLRSICDAYGLVVRRELSRETGRVIETRTVRPVERGRRVRLAWADDQRPVGQALRIDSDHAEPAAQLWTAQVRGPLVESTFTLARGWDPAQENEDDSTYSKVDNHDFATYANVYRLWALNEDAAFAGEAFELGSFFGQEAMRPQPLRFEPCLTLDDSGARRSPIVQMSVDGGETWTEYPGPVVVRPDRAAVYLDDATLPDAFLAAARIGEAAIRVTASLRSPQPVRASRWRGNAFAGVVEPRTIDLGDAFTVARVDPQSIHHAGVAAGVLSAMASDGAARLENWLLERMLREDRATIRGTGRASLLLADAWPWLAVGDRLFDAGRAGVNPARHAEAIAARGASVLALTCRWPEVQARAGGDHPHPSTLVELAF